MDHKQIKDQITGILGDIIERATAMNARLGQDHLLDVELLLEDTRLLYRLLHELRGVAPTEAAPPPRPVPDVPPSEPMPEENPQKQIIDKLSGKANPVVADLFSGNDNSLHSRMSGMQEDRSIGTRLQRKPITNLKEAIGVNEKFLFINELFNGNIQAYHDAIGRLNAMASSSEAFEYLNELTREQKWDAGRSSATIEMLANYVQRRFLEK